MKDGASARGVTGAHWQRSSRRTGGRTRPAPIELIRKIPLKDIGSLMTEEIERTTALPVLEVDPRRAGNMAALPHGMTVARLGAQAEWD